MVRYTLAALAVLAGMLSAAAARGETVLLDFTLPYCGPCQQMMPVVDRLIAEGLPVRKVDASQDQALAQRFGVTSAPTFVMVVDGREVDRVVGPTTYERLRGMLQAAAQPQAAAQVIPSDQVPMLRSTVRIRVIDSKGQSFGTGTIVDSRQGEALVLTCGHLFRTPDGKAPQVIVETFDASPAGIRLVEQLAGEIISYDLQRDVGFVAIRPKSPMQVARVAPSRHGIEVNVPVWNIGCNQGGDPTVQASLITAIDRYHGPPNIEASGAPVVGRSGGGLFNSRGEVIGVCYAADERDNEGLYAGLASLHAELDRLGLSDIYRGGPTAAPGVQTAGAATPTSTGLVPITPPAQPIVRGQDPSASFAPVSRPSRVASTMSPAEQATLEEIAKRADRAEVICIIRPHEPSGRSEVITLQNASPAFVEALTAMQRNAAQR